jgi:hypothetical protein
VFPEFRFLGSGKARELGQPRRRQLFSFLFLLGMVPLSFPVSVDARELTGVIRDARTGSPVQRALVRVDSLGRAARPLSAAIIKPEIDG